MGGGRLKPHAGKGSAGGRGRGEGTRTSNISSMLVTPDVSKLSGWLKAAAYCRVAREGDTKRGEVRVGR